MGVNLAGWGLIAGRTGRRLIAVAEDEIGMLLANQSAVANRLLGAAILEANTA
jgi:hypothetical protein